MFNCCSVKSYLFYNIAQNNNSLPKEKADKNVPYKSIKNAKRS